MNGRGSCTLGVGRLSTDGQGSAIDGVLGERKGGASKGDGTIKSPQRSFVEEARQQCCQVGTTQKRIRTSSRRFYSLGLPSLTPAKIIRLFVPPPGTTLRLSHIMALADLNSIQFYQPPTKTSLPHERVPKALKATGPPVIKEGKPPKALRPSDGWSALWGDDAIDFIDMTDSPTREHPRPLCELAPDPKDTEADIGGKDAVIF